MPFRVFCHLCLQTGPEDWETETEIWMSPPGAALTEGHHPWRAWEKSDSAAGGSPGPQDSPASSWTSRDLEEWTHSFWKKLWEIIKDLLNLPFEGLPPDLKSFFLMIITSFPSLVSMLPSLCREVTEVEVFFRSCGLWTMSYKEL